MDRMTDAVFQTRDEPLAAKQRLENFKMGKGLPSSRPNSLSHKPSHHTHGRSHSRNISTSSASSLSTFSFVNSLGSSHVMNDMSNTTPAPAGPAPSTKRNSHHRRRSSVSTRHESAEMMGVTVPELPPSSTDDNVNFGDKDSIRRRALWALEGKGEVAFSKVEIPELNTEAPAPEKTFDFPSKPSYPPGVGASSNGGLSSLMGKRDSFRLGPSISSKDLLHTLVEEEEEEEEDHVPQDDTVSLPLESQEVIVEPLTPDSLNAPSKPSPVRPRPATLNLRPLSLTPDALITTSHGSLPTPVQTPSPRSGLKSLALVSSPSGSLVESPVSEQARSPPLPARRPSLHLNFDNAVPVISDSKPKRHSSISYKSSYSGCFGAAGLPTPEMTPTSAEYPRSDEEFFSHRPLSASEQHFLFKSHNALLGRITDLERALSRQSRSPRPLSVASDASSEPSDEMLQLISDLKEERDELKRDADGWRARIADLERKIGVLGKRVEAERREAWVARSRVGLLEVEKAGLERALLEKSAAVRDAADELETMGGRYAQAREEVIKMRVEAEHGRAAMDECSQLKAALEEARNKNLRLEAILAGRTSRSGASTGSSASSTDVESIDFSFCKTSPLKAVHEEEEASDDDCDSDEDNGLVGYEDEEDSDLSFRSPGNDSFGSDEDFTHSSMRLSVSVPVLEPCEDDVLSPSSSPALATPAHPGHAPHASLSKAWIFPRDLQQIDEAQLTPSPSDDVDRFFNCLGDEDNSTLLEFSAEDTKNPFSSGYKFGAASVDDDGEELPPFVLPAHVGVEVVEPSRNLEAVIEEEEEEEEESPEHASQENADFSVDEPYSDGSVDLFGSEVGGITFTFTPADDSNDSSLLSSESFHGNETFFEDEDEEEEVPSTFTFPQCRTEKAEEAEKSFSPPPRVPSPSSIPRATALRSFASVGPIVSATPPRAPSSPPTDGFVTPPTKRGGSRPSFIPQPSPIKKGETTQIPRATFMRQPQRKPLNGSAFKPPPKMSMNLQGPRPLQAPLRA